MPDNEKKKLASQHSMDIPHLTAVEMPLIVQNNERVIEMLGGKQKIFQVINANNNNNKSLEGIKTEDEKPLELRLRKDRFHHPIQSITSSREKVVLKISIPKKNLPSDYETNSDKYGIRYLLQHNEEIGGDYKVQPVGIINKTHSFKTMTDFQVNTKHNPYVQKSNRLMSVQNYDQLEQEFMSKKPTPADGEDEKSQEEKSTPFLGNSDFRDPANYENSDKQMPPPPIFSTIKFPFDYRYEKNSISMTVKDPSSGDLKVISKKADVKLYTQVVDFNKSLEVPQAPDPVLVQNQKELQRQVTAKEALPNSYNFDLLYCIRWLRQVFEVKHIWLRKYLEDIVPVPYRRVLKQALPHVTYIYKNGPWRFCNVKYGVNPTADRTYWKYQSEYFRINSLSIKIHNSKQSAKPRSENSDSGSNVKRQIKVLPQTIEVSKIPAPRADGEPEIDSKALSVSRDLLFDGKEVPKTVTFQVGDILDKDICEYLEHVERKQELLRDQLDYQDGWINKQAIETVRKIVRYKLNQLAKDEEINRSKIKKIFSTNNEKEDQDTGDAIDPELRAQMKMKTEEEDSETLDKLDEQDREDDQDQMSDHEQLEESDLEAEVQAEADVESDSEFINSTETDLINRVKQYDSVAAQKLMKISNIIKQESIM